ncbi:MAG: hypothetical protein NC548_52015 [Lachnospiraceae bacterium]|nr:hypothetical protein [Lachnospiraceae bacterium]
MDGELVTGSPSKAARGGGESRPPLNRYGEKFEELCGQYMALGMSYDDYWDGDPTMVKYYRAAEEYKQERENYLAWLHGLYFYTALIDVAPIFNPMSKKKRPKEYMDAPIPMSDRTAKQTKDKENRQKMANGKNIMQIMAKGFNAKFMRKEG